MLRVRDAQMLGVAARVFPEESHRHLSPNSE